MLCHLLAVGLLLAGGTHGPPATGAKPIPDDELRQKVQELEKRVGQLEETVKQLQGLLQRFASSVDGPLVGNWALVKSREKGITGLRFETDRTCRVSLQTKERSGIFNGTYEVAGMEVGIRLALGSNISLTVPLRIVSVSDKELIIRSGYGVEKEEEIRLERK